MTAVTEGKALIPQDFLEAIATERDVSDTEFGVLSLAIQGESTEAIAKKLGTEPQVIRNRLREVYKKFQIRGMGPGKLAKLQQHLVSEYQVRSSTQRVQPLSDRATPQRNWGEAPDVSVFYGRNKELTALEQWLVKDRCRLVTVLGMGGMGKTTLSRKLAEQIQDEFEYVIWRSLSNAPSLQDLLADLIAFLSNQQESELPEDGDRRVSLLVDYLSNYRCLLVFDDVETILRSGDRLLRYSKGYEGYGVLFRRVGEARHQSSLLLISQEKLREISLLESPTRLVRSWQLTGLKSEDARKILQEKGLTGEKYWEDLIGLSQGNPFALKIAATTIKDLFNGNVAEFTKQKTWVFDEFREILEQQFQRLSNLEQVILRNLASEPNSVSLPALKETIPESFSTSDLMEALTSLIRRSWIETASSKDKNFTETLYTLQYLIKKYIKKYQLTPPTSQ